MCLAALDRESLGCNVSRGNAEHLHQTVSTSITGARAHGSLGDGTSAVRKTYLLLKAEATQNEISEEISMVDTEKSTRFYMNTVDVFVTLPLGNM